jgi:PAS domain-containing protein
MGYCSDVSPQKAAEMCIRESELKYRAVVKDLREVVFRTDRTGRWTFLNPGWKDVRDMNFRNASGSRSWLLFMLMTGI